MKLSITTFNMMRLSITIFSMMKLSIKTFCIPNVLHSIRKLSMMTLSIIFNKMWYSA